MNLEFLNIYNNIVKLTRNKKLYLNLGRSDEFSDRLIFLFLHFALFLKHYKSQMTKDRSQKLFDFFIRQIELSISCLLYTSPSPRDRTRSRMPSSA